MEARVIKENPLIEGVRAGADIEWRPRIKKLFSANKFEILALP